MRVKKNPKKDLSRNSGIYFALGLAMALSITYVALEWKTYADDINYDYAQNVEDALDEEAPIFTLAPPPPPPPPPVVPDVIEIVDDEDPIEETFVESTESSEDVEVLAIEDVEFTEAPVDASIPFAVIEKVPVFPGCESAKDKRVCFNKKMAQHIRKNFRYPEPAQEMGIQGRVDVMFTIQKDGSIGDVRLRGPDKNLEKEATRIISKLPQMTPGRQRGTAVRVPFSIPITFKLNN